MYWIWIVFAVFVLAGVAIWLFTRRKTVHAWGREVQIARARESFALQRERLHGLFMQAASATGKPRGLRWVQCDFEPELTLARERSTKQLVGLVPVTIRFEAVEGGDMEGIAAVGNLRNATAVFAFSSGQWQTNGKAVFNLNPPEVLHHFQKDYESVQDTSHDAQNGAPITNPPGT
jgi:hypothetical protein